MSSIESRRNKATGTESHRVRFRHGAQNRAVTFATRKAAESWRTVFDTLGADKALSLLAELPVHKPVPTVAEQVARYIEHLTGVTSGTKVRYEHILRDTIEPDLGALLLTDLTRDHVAAWVNTQHDAAKTIRNRQSLLSAALTSAMREGLIPANPAKGIRLPNGSHVRREMVFLTPAEFATLHDALAAHWRPFALFLVGTGVRFGEATALTVGDLDLPHRSARIRQAWKYTAGATPELGPPKSARSRRTVAIPPVLVPTLARLVAGRPSAGYVFTNTRGNPIRSSSLHEGVWQPVVAVVEREHGKRPRVHDLRHTYASWALTAVPPISLPVLQRQMGHESITTTIDTYGHLVRSDYDGLADVIGAGLPLPVLPQITT